MVEVTPVSNLTQTELEEQLRLLSERLRHAVDLLDLLTARVERLEGRRRPDIGDSDEITFDDVGPPRKRDSEYDRMDKLDAEIDSEIRRGKD